MKDKIMKWLRGGMHRVYAAIILTLLLALSWNLMASEQDMYESEMTHIEQAMYGTDLTGTKWVCLLTADGVGFTDINGYVGFTCAPTNRDGKWRFCAGKSGSPEFFCAPPGMKIQQAVPPSKSSLKSTIYI